MLIAIPARRASSRLPEKLLLRDTGMPLLAHTIQRARRAADLVAKKFAGAQVAVACDDAALFDVAEEYGARAVLTGQCGSGTERICAALASLPAAETIVNLQADEPETPASWIADCFAVLREEPRVDVVTVAVPIPDGDQSLPSPSVVKVVLDHQGYALYFSRAPIPFLREGGKPPLPRALRHVGLYGYSRNFLDRYASFPASSLEECECLEQLRFLQAGARIKVLVRSEDQPEIRGVDTRADYDQFVERFRRGLRD